MRAGEGAHLRCLKQMLLLPTTIVIKTIGIFVSSSIASRRRRVRSVCEIFGLRRGKSAFR